MKPQDLKHHFVDAMAKHLPPSSSTLRLLDIDGQVGEILAQRRGDLDVCVVRSEQGVAWDISHNSIDAVVAFDINLDKMLLQRILDRLRPGGRFTAVMSSEQVSADYVKLLEKQGYVRILVEPAVDDLGVLIRGEKPHTTADTLDRIQQVALADADLLKLETFKGRYVHLLIQQLPNKPVWKLEPDDKITWHAVAIAHDDVDIVLGFSSLPKAVGFMQPAVVEGLITDINKVGKFAKETVASWDDTMTVVLNPTLESIRRFPLKLVDIDPTTAEASDE